MKKPTILFSQAHHESVCIDDSNDNQTDFGAFFDFLRKTYRCHPCDEHLLPDKLVEASVVVLGAPFDDLQEEETTALTQFVEAGGGLLLMSNADIAYSPPEGFKQLLELAGVHIQEYLNYPPESLRVFRPHVVTANLTKIRVGKLAHLSLLDEAKVRPLAFTKATQQPIIAVSCIGQGRIGIIGDSSLFADALFESEEGDNCVFAANLFAWLTKTHDLDIEVVKVQGQFDWGRTGDVELVLRNPTAKPIRHIECILSSDNGADIQNPIKNVHDLLSNKAVVKRWKVKPTILGQQVLSLSIFIERNEKVLRFSSLLPEITCLAKGFLSMVIKNKKGESCINFRTNDTFIVEGSFFTNIKNLSYKLGLEVSNGLKIIQENFSNDCYFWEVEAKQKGTQTLKLQLLNNIKDNNQQEQSKPQIIQHSLAMVVVKSSIQDQIRDVYVNYVLPLDAQIISYLERIDSKLVTNNIKNLRLDILQPYEYIDAAYSNDVKILNWLQNNVLPAAYNENFYNIDLVETLLNYLVPKYLPERGGVVPCEPVLASHLISIHPDYKKSLEYCFLYSEDSDDITIKQNIASYLLHKKYGDGFFYTHTRLGQQIALITRYRNNIPDNYRYTMDLLQDSSLVVQSGFAAWLELTFLNKLDLDIKQAYDTRRKLLLDEYNGLSFSRSNDFFNTFPVEKYKSHYREGWEYLEEAIRRKFSFQCAIQLFLLSTNIDFGINLENDIFFSFSAEEMEERLSNPQTGLQWCSHIRLRFIAEWLHDNMIEVKQKMQRVECSEKCHNTGCSLKEFFHGNLY